MPAPPTGCMNAGHLEQPIISHKNVTILKLVKTLQDIERYTNGIMKKLHEEECKRKTDWDAQPKEAQLQNLAAAPKDETTGIYEEYYKRMKHKGIMEMHRKLHLDIIELKMNTETLQNVIIRVERVQRKVVGEPEKENGSEKTMPEKENEAALQDNAREQGWQELLRECHAAMKEPDAVNMPP